MKAVIFDAIGKPLRFDTAPDPTPGPGEVLLQVHRCGICGSDLHMTEDEIFGLPSGAIMGHEFSGTVVELGAGVERLKKGDNVTALPLGSCGKCAACLSGELAWCETMQINGGGYAEYVVVHERQCVRTPASLSHEDGALVEPLAVGLHGIIQAEMKPGARIMVIGAGPIALAAIYWARLLGAGKIGATATSRQREGLALSMGADIFVDPANSGEEAVAQALGGAPDIVLECVGKPGILQKCIEIVRPRGTIVVLGLCTKQDHYQPFVAFVKEVRIQMAALYSVRDFEVSVDALDAGHVAPRLMITDRVSLEELPQSFEALRQRTHQCKVMIVPTS